jgi:hypothetical protein
MDPAIARVLPNRFGRSAQQMRRRVPSSLRSSAPGQPERLGGAAWIGERCFLKIPKMF